MKAFRRRAEGILVALEEVAGDDAELRADIDDARRELRGDAAR
jgi:hypothetical protein